MSCMVINHYLTTQTIIKKISGYMEKNIRSLDLNHPTAI